LFQAEIGFQNIKKRQQALQNVIAYVGKPRLATALSLLNVTDEIEKHLDKVSLPLLILHGAEDRVTDPAVSRALYEQASTEDKTLHVYDSSWHAVLEGESDEVIDRAIGDIVTWLDAHAATFSRC
jgi:caffeoylshikimate esterase